MGKFDLFEAIESSEVEQAKAEIEDLINELTEITNSQRETVLHVAANYNVPKILNYAIDRYNQLTKENNPNFTVQNKLRWLNQKDGEGFSCLHYAVFRGNFKMAFRLEEEGADVYAINKQGLTVMHIAAQGDSPILIYYYLQKGMKIGSKDSKGSTPLHWACYSGQQNSAFALISMGSELDLQDFTHGLTPLHLAVMAGNGRIVKKLLMNGCDRNVKNYNGKLALDVAQENQYRNISEMIIDKQGYEEFLNIKTPYRKVGKRTFPFYFFMFSFLINFFLNISFVVFCHFSENKEIGLSYLALGIVVIGSYLFVYNKSPGYLVPNRKQNIFQVLKRNHPSKICFDCMILKPQRSRHCQICQRCISVYDHHCPWVANCIGAHNYIYFFVFLVLIWLFVAFTIVFEVANLVKVDWENVTVLEEIRNVCIFFGLLVGGLFILPLSYLMFVQMKNLLLNKTTFERYSYQPNSYGTTKSTNNSDHNDSAYKESELSEHLMRSESERSFASKKTVYMVEDEANCHNCYQMCFDNSKNIVYHNGNIK